MTDENKTSETSLWEKVMQFVSFWLSVLILITGGLWLYFRSEIEADTEDFIPWAWGKVTGDSLGIFFGCVLLFMFAITFHSFVIRKPSK